MELEARKYLSSLSALLTSKWVFILGSPKWENL